LPGPPDGLEAVEEVEHPADVALGGQPRGPLAPALGEPRRDEARGESAAAGGGDCLRAGAYEASFVGEDYSSGQPD